MPLRLDFRITFPGTEPMHEAMVVYRRTRSFRDFFEGLVVDLREYEEQVFAREGKHEGLSQWAPLSEQYARWKQLRFPGQPILTLTGRLRRSLASQTDDSVVEITDQRLRYGTAVEYAIYHQYGTRKMPKRPPLRISSALRRRIMIALRQYVFREIPR